MQKRVFLTGPSGCGKTYMIREVLGARAAYSGGFVSERICDASGNLLGYDLFPACRAGGIDGLEGKRFLDYTESHPSHNNEVFREYARELLEEAKYYPFAMLDEIGGFEMIISQFREALSEYLTSGHPCIGVLKSFENAEELRFRLGLGDKYSVFLSSLKTYLENDPDSLIIEMTCRDDGKAKALVEEWAQEYANI